MLEEPRLRSRPREGHAECEGQVFFWSWTYYHKSAHVPFLKKHLLLRVKTSGAMPLMSFGFLAPLSIKEAWTYIYEERLGLLHFQWTAHCVELQPKSMGSSCWYIVCHEY